MTPHAAPLPVISASAAADGCRTSEPSTAPPRTARPTAARAPRAHSRSSRRGSRGGARRPPTPPVRGRVRAAPSPPSTDRRRTPMTYDSRDSIPCSTCSPDTDGTPGSRVRSPMPRTQGRIAADRGVGSWHLGPDRVPSPVPVAYDGRARPAPPRAAPASRPPGRRPRTRATPRRPARRAPRRAVRPAARAPPRAPPGTARARSRRSPRAHRGPGMLEQIVEGPPVGRSNGKSCTSVDVMRVTLDIPGGSCRARLTWHAPADHFPKWTAPSQGRIRYFRFANVLAIRPGTLRPGMAPRVTGV